MDVPLVIKHRLEDLGLEQRDLARAAEVTESYISQLLSRKKAPPAPNRTDIYDKMGQVREIFEKQPFGELERLITQKLLDVVKRLAKEELESENWLRLLARLSDRSYEQMRVDVLEFLDTDVFDVSLESSVSFLDPMIESWDIDLATFGVELVLSRRMAPGHPKRFEFIEIEREPEPAFDQEPGLTEFLQDSSLSGNATEEEIEFLKKLRFKTKRPTSLYYYRELQNFRDPLHFRTP